MNYDLFYFLFIFDGSLLRYKTKRNNEREKKLLDLTNDYSILYICGSCEQIYYLHPSEAFHVCGYLNIHY